MILHMIIMEMVRTFTLELVILQIRLDQIADLIFVSFKKIVDIKETTINKIYRIATNRNVIKRVVIKVVTYR